MGNKTVDEFFMCFPTAVAEKDSTGSQLGIVVNLGYMVNITQHTLFVGGTL